MKVLRLASAEHAQRKGKRAVRLSQCGQEEENWEIGSERAHDGASWVVDFYFECDGFQELCKV